MKLPLILSCLFFSSLIANEGYCNVTDSDQDGFESKITRQYYNIGDSITEEDQQHAYSVCYSDGIYPSGSTFKLSDYTSEIILISMNATW